ncbi:uncharacterized protein DEA37_0008136 [Paragonimus westermani]|uniref:Helix-turn-helix domain-containing protein n=1 Tax=Paragonimus westermani TaxID=34504 RepID=A0A5J4NM67_9TREM|nr:uncharacterized protein DEA37_0008136 [Paragonimus westermani]
MQARPLLVLPSKVTVVTQNPSPGFVCQIFDLSECSPLYLANDYHALEVVLPKLQLDNQVRDVLNLDTRLTFTPVGLKIPSVSWTQATRQLPILRSPLTPNISTTTTPETVAPWFLRALDASLKLNGLTLSSGSLLATLIETVQSCTHSMSTIDWCLHVQLVFDEPDHRRDVLFTPTLEQLFQAVNSIEFLVAGLRQTFSSNAYWFQSCLSVFNYRRVIPLLSPLESSFRAFDDHDLNTSQPPSNVSLPTLNSGTPKRSSSQSHFADADTTSGAFCMSESSFLTRYIYGDALELTIPDNVVLFADCKLLNRLSHVVQSSTVSSSGNCDLSQPHPVANLFDRYFHPTTSVVSIPLRLLFAVRHVRLVTWTDQLKSSACDAIAHTVVDISHPHLSIHFKSSGESGLVDQLDCGIEDMQVDMRITKLDTENTQRHRPLNWTRFTPVAFRPCRSPISFCCPSFPLRSFIREPIPSFSTGTSEVLFGTTFGDSDPHTGVPKPLLTIRMMRSVDNADTIRGPGIPNLTPDQDPESWRQRKFHVYVNVGRAIQCSINPDVVTAFGTLIDAVLPEDQDKEVVKPVALNENNGLQWVHWVLTRFTVVSGNLPSLKISLSTSCSGKLDSTAAACLQCDIQRTNFCVYSDDLDDRLSFSRIKFQLYYQGIGIFVYPLFSPPLERGTTSSVVLMAAYGANQCVSLLWPHTSLSCLGTARIATCPHIGTAGQAYRFPVDVELMFRLDDGCQIDVPVHGPAFHALRSLISVYSPLPRVWAPSAESVGIAFCDQCAAEQPILFKDDLRDKTFALPSIFEGRISESTQLATDQVPSHMHPCWPWAASETCLNQLPLSEHPWPCSNGIVFCDNLRGMYHYYSLSGQVTSTPIHDQAHVDCHWIGMTWMYAEPRTPVRVRILPAPFGFIERYSELSYPHGLESTLDDAVLRNVMPSSSVSDYHSRVSRGSSALAGTKVSAKIWRILVDLRARPVSLANSNDPPGSTDMSDPEAIQSHPVALVHISPLMLAGCVELDSVQNRSVTPNQSMFCRILCPSLHIGLLQQQEPQVDQHPSGLELARAVFKGLSLTHKRSLSFFSSGAVRNLLEFEQCTVCTANPNWACLQSLWRLHKFSIHVTQPSGLVRSHLVDMQLRLGVDRLVALCHLTRTLSNACAIWMNQNLDERSGCTEEDVLPHNDQDNLDLRWMVVNCSDQCNFPGIHWSEPVETVWPPYRSDSQLNSTIAFALTIVWKEDTVTDRIYPSLSVIFELPYPSGAPGKIFIQSDLVVRNLLPIELDFGLSSSSVKKHEAHRKLSHDAAKRKTAAASSRLRVQRGPSATFVCSTYTRDRQTRRVISIRLSGLQLPNDMDQQFPHQFDSDHWSDAFVFCVPTPNAENGKLLTSQRSLFGKEDTLAFLDINIKRRNDGTVCRSVHRKSTWGGQYLNFNSFSPIQHKRSLVRCLFHRARIIRTGDTLDAELKFIRDTLVSNGYPLGFIAFHSKPKLINPQETSVPKKPVYMQLPYKGDSNMSFLTRRLMQAIQRTYNAATLRLLSRTKSLTLPHIKTRISELSTSHCIYQFTCSCGDVYIGRTDRSLRLRMKEHVPKYIEDLMCGVTRRDPTKQRKAASSIARHLLVTRQTFSAC